MQSTAEPHGMRFKISNCCGSGSDTEPGARVDLAPGVEIASRLP